MMKIAIMQPYFFPYLGYFSLIKNTDRFILFDTPQFIRHGWIERNRILKQNGGWQYINAPLKKRSLETAIRDVKIKTSEPWQNKIISQLSHYKKTAPFYFKTIAVVKDALNTESDSITDINLRILEKCCEYLNIELNIDVFSEMDLPINPVNAPDEWALEICKSLGNVKEYWNPIGGLDFFDKKKYEDANLKIHFQKMTLEPYPQKSEQLFESGLSIIDVMMFNSPDDISKMLDKYELL